MYDFDTYTLYEIKKRNVYSVRINVILGDPVQGDILKTAAEKAFRRFPYYAKKVVINSQDAYELEPCEKPLNDAPPEGGGFLRTEVHALRLKAACGLKPSLFGLKVRCKPYLSSYSSTILKCSSLSSLPCVLI